MLLEKVLLKQARVTSDPKDVKGWSREER